MSGESWTSSNSFILWSNRGHENALFLLYFFNLMAGNFNRTLNFLPTRRDEDWELRDLPMIASVAMQQGVAVYYVGDGTVTIVTASTANFAGILAEEIATTDDDYATSLKKKQVWIPKSFASEAEFSVGAGTFTTADVGKSVKFNDEKGLAVDTAGVQARISGYASSTRGRCTFNVAIS